MAPPRPISNLDQFWGIGSWDDLILCSVDNTTGECKHYFVRHNPLQHGVYVLVCLRNKDNLASLYVRFHAERSKFTSLDFRNQRIVAPTRVVQYHLVPKRSRDMQNQRCIHVFGARPYNFLCAFLQILLVMFAGMLAFDVLDRLTGDWSVTNTDWFQGFYAAVIQVLEKLPCF